MNRSVLFWLVFANNLFFEIQFYENDHKLSCAILFLQENIGIGLFQQCYSKLQDNTLKQEKIENFGLNSKLMKNFEILNGSPMSSAQLSLYTIIGKYIDFYASELQIDCTVLFLSLFSLFIILSNKCK